MNVTPSPTSTKVKNFIIKINVMNESVFLCCCDCDMNVAVVATEHTYVLIGLVTAVHRFVGRLCSPFLLETLILYVLTFVPSK